MDLDKVIKGLELCLGSIDSAGCPEGCPYYEACQKYENYAVFQPVMRDALEALKTFHKPVFMVGSKRCADEIEQEAIKAGGQPLLIMRDVEMVPVLTADALTLLKAQEPRVMTKEEIIGWDGYIWFEFNGMKAMKTVLIDHGMVREPFRGDYPTKELSWGTCQETWRAWTARPTEEQRKAVKWDADAAD